MLKHGVFEGSADGLPICMAEPRAGSRMVERHIGSTHSAHSVEDSNLREQLSSPEKQSVCARKCRRFLHLPSVKEHSRILMLLRSWRMVMILWCAYVSKVNATGLLLEIGNNDPNNCETLGDVMDV